MDVLKTTDEKLAMIENFNERLLVFDDAVSESEQWLTDARNKIDEIIKPQLGGTFSPEDRVTKAMEIQEDIMKKSDFLTKQVRSSGVYIRRILNALGHTQEEEREQIFPKGDEKVSSDAQRFLDRLTKARSTIDALKEEIKSECCKFSQDIKFWAEFQTGIKEFDPWLTTAESRKAMGLAKPESLQEAQAILEDSKVNYTKTLGLNQTNSDETVVQNFQGDCENKLKILDEAASSAQKMTVHAEADVKVDALKTRWADVHNTTKEWVARMNTLVECWNKLEGNVGELSSWVSNTETGDLV